MIYNRSKHMRKTALALTGMLIIFLLSFIEPNNSSAKDKTVNIILKLAEMNDGLCPCNGNTSEDKHCPCSDYREKDHCCCGLYVKIEQ